jgi:hypothetical protein
MEGTMKKRLAIVFFCSLVWLAAVQPATAQEETTTIPIKEYIDVAGPVNLIVRIYDAPQGGALLFQVPKVVIAEDGQLNDEIEVPAELLESHPTVFVEVAKASSPSEPLDEERMEFSLPDPEADAASGRKIRNVAVCNTCGGPYPGRLGAVGGRTSWPPVKELGKNCGGTLHDAYDKRPWICGQ